MDLLSKELKFIHNNKIIPSFEIPEVASSACPYQTICILKLILKYLKYIFLYFDPI